MCPSEFTVTFIKGRLTALHVNQPFLISMKEIKLTKGFTAKVDDEDFDFLNRFKWAASKCGKDHYAVTSYYHQSKKYKIYMHRLILLAFDKIVIVDHQDRDTFNNQKSNLRMCSKMQNQWNNRLRDGASSKYRGVSFHAQSRGYVAQIANKGENIYIGYYRNEIEAAKAYNDAAIRLRGEFANPNTF